MNFKRKQRFEERECSEPGGLYAVWDLIINDWYKVGGEKLKDWSKTKSEERCNNLQKQFEWANPFGFLEAEMSGPDFMDDEYYLYH